MDLSVVPAVLLGICSLCCFGTGIIAFRRYSLTKSERLFIVGLSMIIAAVGIIGGALDGIPALNPYAFEWSWYLGTSVGYLLLFLSSIVTSAEQFRILKRWGIVAATLLVILLALSTTLPDISNNRSAIVVLNALRIIICSLGFFRYLMLYTSKGTRFSLLLCLAFLFIGIGYATIIVQALSGGTIQLPVIDTMIRVVGNVLLFAAFVLG